MDNSSLSFNIDSALSSFDDQFFKVDASELRQRLPLRDTVDLTVFGFDEGSKAFVIINATKNALQSWHRSLLHYLKFSQKLSELRVAAIKEFEDLKLEKEAQESRADNADAEEEGDEREAIDLVSAAADRDEKASVIDEYDAQLLNKMMICRNYLIQFLIESIVLKVDDYELAITFDGSEGQIELINEVLDELIPTCLKEIGERKAQRALNAGRSFRQRREQRNLRSKASEEG